MTSAADSPVTVALLGNPNTGKSTLFTALAGVRQRVGNYPGVTVEKKIGHMTHAGRRFTLIDLPGTYSLAPRSPDEMVAVDVLLGRQADTPRPDVLLCIVDASNLELNLYLVSQALEMKLPTVVALNMIDIARDREMEIDVPALAVKLGVPVVPVQANKGIGLPELRAAVLAAHGQPPRTAAGPFPEAFDNETRELAARLEAADGSRKTPYYLVERLLLDTSAYLERFVLPEGGDDRWRQNLAQARERLARAGCPIPAVEAISRYGWVGRTLEGIVTRPPTRRVMASERLDRLLTHRVWGSVSFLLLMLVVFQAVFAWSGPAMDLISTATDGLGAAVEGRMPAGAVRSLLVDGMLAGVGGVLVFLPQILILFFFIGILEDCGYMARAAYLMDKLMVRVGLSGKSFIPLLSSFACAIPGVMATRVIENRRDRLTTILIAPLMSCSARLPVYTLLTGAFIPDSRYGPLSLRGLTMTSMYLLGMVAAALAAWAFKRTLLRGPTPPFVMQLPTYKVPSVRLVLYRMLDRGWSFVRRAGTLVVAVSILVWAGLYYPHNADEVEGPYRERLAEIDAALERLAETDPKHEGLTSERQELQNEILGAYNRQSYLGQLGHAIEPAVKPLGWDWRIGCAVIASFPAREVVVATLGVIYNLGKVDVGEQEERSRLETGLRQATWDGTERPVFSVPAALSVMVFFSLCAQCASTLVVIRRETNSWRWPAFTFAYMTALAYVAALATYQAGMLFG